MPVLVEEEEEPMIHIYNEPTLDYAPLPEPVIIIEPTDYNEVSIVELAAVTKEASEEPTTHDSSSVYGYGALALGVAASAVYLYKRR